jgi:hypothetical protein
VLRFRLMVKRGQYERPQASEGEADALAGKHPLAATLLLRSMIDMGTANLY